ncbi:Galactose/methyl galactoside import ATP-binding protein MglA [subsurface metagenome]
MVEEGHSIIFISHKLEETLAICDRVIVPRRGEVVGTGAAGDMDKRELARMMVGRDIIFDFKRKELERGPLVLDVQELTVPGDPREIAVKGVSFQVYQNEIFGIAGVSGNGQRELIEAITGLRKATNGSIRINENIITNASARIVSHRGIAHVPEERIKFGIVPNLCIYENAVLKQHHKKLYSRTLFLNFNNIKTHAQSIVEEFHIDTPSIDTQVKNLSGGNIQKLILGREITADPSLLVAAHPTYGLDVGATEYIRSRLLERREKGVAVLLVSKDLEEIGLMMAGSRPLSAEAVQ